MKRRQALRQTALFAGTTITAPALLSTLQSCQNQLRRDWKPTFFSASEADFVTTIIDKWLPKTDTPGALEVKVDMFLDLVFANLYNKEDQAIVKAEIESFNANCKQNYGDVFVSLSSDDQLSVMRSAESQSPKYNGKVWGTAVGRQEPVGFYRDLKSLALWGYFSSEEIGKNVLNYDPIPGTYIGCIPVSDVGNVWTL